MIFEKTIESQDNIIKNVSTGCDIRHNHSSF